MTERPDNTRLHEWLDDTVGQIPDPVAGTRQVMSQVQETPQAGRWLPFPVFRRKAKVQTPTATDTTDLQPSPIPATNGHIPTVIGRTQTMFSPAKAITAGALVFAIGGVMLIAQPFGQQGGSVPGAATDAEAVPATWVTGNIVSSPSCSGPRYESDDAVRHAWRECRPQRWTTSDPRLTGEATAVWNADIYETDSTVDETDSTVDISVITRAYHVRNEAGGWACRSNMVAHGDDWWPEQENGELMMCVGDGGYVGLSAILFNNGTLNAEEIAGLIFSGDFPPLPEPPAAE